MKKNILSLVAFMAFSVSAFANTVEVKEEAVEERDCFAEATFLSNAVTQVLKLSDVESYIAFSMFYDSCVSSGECSTCLEEVVVTG
jgi:hypothetical protein